MYGYRRMKNRQIEKLAAKNTNKFWETAVERPSQVNCWQSLVLLAQASQLWWTSWVRGMQTPNRRCWVINVLSRPTLSTLASMTSKSLPHTSNRTTPSSKVLHHMSSSILLQRWGPSWILNKDKNEWINWSTCLDFKIANSRLVVETMLQACLEESANVLRLVMTW